MNPHDAAAPIAEVSFTIPAGVLTAAYIAASALFILSLGGLANQESARRGNSLGVAGMIIAVVATVAGVTTQGLLVSATSMAVGAVIGATLAARVGMTSMPQLVAILHSFVGLAAVLVGIRREREHARRRSVASGRSCHANCRSPVKHTTERDSFAEAEGHDCQARPKMAGRRSQDLLPI